MTYSIYIFIFVMLFMPLAYLFIIYKGKQQAFTKYYDVVFHRGGRDARPENTLYAFQYALENGASSIECDIQLTKDGHIVVYHNPTLNPDITTDKNGNQIEPNKYAIHNMTLDEIKTFNVGKMDTKSEYYLLHGRTQVQTNCTIPTLRELFELIKSSKNEQIKLRIEAKYYSDPVMYEYKLNPDKDIFLSKFLELVNEFGFEKRIIFKSFDWDIVVRLKKLNPAIETSALYNEQPSWGEIDSTTLWLDKTEPSPWLAGLNIHDFNNNPVSAAHFLGIDGISPYYKEITKQQVDEAHNYGMKVTPWTVNNIEDMNLLYNMGVDGMITDKPWILIEFIKSKGENVFTTKKVDLPYHLEPKHYDACDIKITNGNDSSH